VSRSRPSPSRRCPARSRPFAERRRLRADRPAVRGRVPSVGEAEPERCEGPRAGTAVAATRRGPGRQAAPDRRTDAQRRASGASPAGASAPGGVHGGVHLERKPEAPRRQRSPPADGAIRERSLKALRQARRATNAILRATVRGPTGPPLGLSRRLVIRPLAPPACPGPLLDSEPSPASRAGPARRGGRSSDGRAPGCGPGGRGFESRRSPLKIAGKDELAVAQPGSTAR